MLIQHINSILEKNHKVAFLIFSLSVLIYTLFPIYIGEQFVFPNQIEHIVVITYMSVFIAGYMLLSFAKHLKNRVIKISAIDIILLLYFLYYACLCLFHFENISDEILFECFSLSVLYLFFRQLNELSTKILLGIFPIAGVAQITYGIKNQTAYFSHGYTFADITGLFYNSGIFGGFIALFFVTTLSLMFIRNFHPAFRYGKRILLFVLLLFLLQLFATRSRSAWSACLIGILYIVCSYFDLYNRTLKLSLLKKITLIILLLGIAYTTSIGLYQLKRDSADGRLLVWQVACTMIKDKPFSGHGPNGFEANYMEYQANYLQSHPQSLYSYLADDTQYAFNEFLRIGVEQGVVGLLFSFALLYYLFFKAKNQNHKNNRYSTLTIAKASLISLIVFGLFSYPMAIIQFNIAGIFFIALIANNSIVKIFSIERLQTDHWRIRRHFLQLGMMLIGIISLGSLGSSLNRYSRTCKQWNAALKELNPDDPDRNLGMLKVVYPALKNNSLFLTTYGKALVWTQRYNDAIPILLKANQKLPLSARYIELGICYKKNRQYSQAKTAWHRASRMVPSLFAPDYQIAKMDLETKKTDEARKTALLLLRKKVKIRSPDLTGMLNEMNLLIEKTNKLSSEHSN